MNTTFVTLGFVTSGFVPRFCYLRFCYLFCFYLSNLLYHTTGLHSDRAGSSSNQGFPRFNIIPSIFGRGSGNDAVEFLDEAGYIAAATVKPGGDAYARNKFNQVESDRIPSNRAVPDTRNQM